MSQPTVSTRPSSAVLSPSGTAGTRDTAANADVLAKVADFAELRAAAANAGSGSLDRLLDVTVTATAELGRTTMSIADVLNLGPESVLELDRPVSEPVDLVVQGVRLARGEVVVVDDRFAIRIKEILDPKKRL